MNRRGFVGAALAGVGGFFFPQKLKASCSKGLSHAKLIDLIVSDTKQVHCTRFSSEFYQIIYDNSFRSGDVLIIPEHQPDERWRHWDGGRKMNFSCVSFRGILLGGHDWKTRYFVKENDRWFEVQLLDAKSQTWDWV